MSATEINPAARSSIVTLCLLLGTLGGGCQALVNSAAGVGNIAAIGKIAAPQAVLGSAAIREPAAPSAPAASLAAPAPAAFRPSASGAGLSLPYTLTLAAPAMQESEREDDEYERIQARAEANQMIHRRAILEVGAGVFIPLDNDFKAGFAFTAKAEMEVVKNLYLGMGFEYIKQTIDETIANISERFQAGDPSATRDALNADPEQWLNSLDRYHVLFLYDYDIPFWEGDHPLIFRHGIGLGAILVDGQEVSSGTFAQDPDVRFFAQFLARPSIALRWQALENLLLFVEGAFDYVPESNLTVEGAFFTRRTKISEKVDFSGFSISGGLSFSF